MQLKRILFVALLSAAGIAPRAFAEEIADPVLKPVAQDLADLSLEDLLTVEVSSVAKKRQKANEAPAAVYVITQEDIRRSGENTIPGLLRLAPGVEVGQLDGNVTAVTIRGFNSRFSNKLLVLVDGRAVYSPSFSGVMWDQLPTAVEDIERIEIVRGPGATIWGANAVNGVINIITKHGVDSLGGAVSVRGDTTGGATVYGRYGRQIGDSSTLRLYAKALQNPGASDVTGKGINDGWTTASAGFRFDAQPNDRDSVTLQGDGQVGQYQSTLFQGLSPVPVSTDEHFSNENLLARWTRRQDQDHEFTVQAYLDNLSRTDFGVNFHRSVADFDFSQTAKLSDGNALVWGLGYRYSQDKVVGATIVSFSPTRSSDQVWSGFVQDEQKFLDGRLAITAGAKLEHNDYTGVEVQPSLRAIWLDPAGWTVWAAASRAVRTPSRYERDATVGFTYFAPFSPQNPSPFPMQVVLQGSRNLTAEVLNAYEVGWRKSFSKTISIDATAFYNQYDNAISYFPGTPQLVGSPIPTLLRSPITQVNQAQLTATGAEVSVKAAINNRLRMDVVASTLHLTSAVAMPVPGAASVSDPGQSPKWQAAWRTYYDLSDTVELYASLRHVSQLTSKTTPAYTDLDLKLTWRATDHADLYIRGDNLLEARRLEFRWASYPAPPAYVDRKVEAGIAVRF